MGIPWIEKYRPKVLKEIVGNNAIVKRLEEVAKSGTIPNMLLCGTPGIGKTTIMHCLAIELLGPECSRKGLLELNASDERGIDVIRNKIKSFSSKKLSLPLGTHKIVLLDESDSITPAAQQALRRIIELHSDSTRFIFACNNSEKIIEPLQSRCVILRFAGLEEEAIFERIKEICKFEGVSSNTPGLKALCFTADGDLRRAINNLQSTHYGCGFVSEENVYTICDIPHPTVIGNILLDCYRGDFASAFQRLETLLEAGYSRADLITAFFRVVKRLPAADFPDNVRLRAIREIGLTHLRIAEGVEKIQLEALLARLSFQNFTKS